MTKDNALAVKQSISLRIMGGELDPEEVTKLLGASPSYYHTKGDANMSSSGRLLGQRSEGIWTYDFICDATKTIDENLQALFHMLDDKQSVMSEFKLEGLRYDVMIGFFGVDEALGFSISAGTLATLGKLGLGIDFDIYVI